MLADEIPEIEIVDQTAEDLVKITERRKKLEEQREIESKLRKKSFQRDANLPELKIGERLKLIVLEMGAIEKDGKSQIYWEPMEMDFEVEKIYIHPEEPESKRVWYGGVYRLMIDGVERKRLRIFPRAHLLSVGKSLAEKFGVSETVNLLEQEVKKETSKIKDEENISL